MEDFQMRYKTNEWSVLNKWPWYADDRVAVLDLELNVNRRKIEFNVHYKKTNTNIAIKNNQITEKRSRKESSKVTVIVQAHCDTRDTRGDEGKKKKK